MRQGVQNTPGRRGVSGQPPLRTFSLSRPLPGLFLSKAAGIEISNFHWLGLEMKYVAFDF